MLRAAGHERTTASERAGTMIERQVKHLTRLVDDLLDVSRITQGKIELRKETVDARPRSSRQAVEAAGRSSRSGSTS